MCQHSNRVSFKAKKKARVAQWLAYQPSKLRVASSSLAMGTHFFLPSLPAGTVPFFIFFAKGGPPLFVAWLFAAVLPVLWWCSLFCCPFVCCFKRCTGPGRVEVQISRFPKTKDQIFFPVCVHQANFLFWPLSLFWPTNLYHFPPVTLNRGIGTMFRQYRS